MQTLCNTLLDVCRGHRVHLYTSQTPPSILSQDNKALQVKKKAKKELRRVLLSSASLLSFGVGEMLDLTDAFRYGLHSEKKNLLRSSCKSFEPPSFHVIYYISIRLQHRFSLTSPDSVALFDSSARVLSPRSISRTLAPSQRWRRIHQLFFSSLSFRLPHWSSSARCRLLRKWKTCSVGQAEASSASVVGGWRKREGAGVRGAAGRAIRLTVSRCVEVAFIARRVRSKQAPNYTAAATLPRLRRGGPLTYKKRKKGSEDSTDTGR